jgi:cyclohexyl-isocyanide hydratase
MPERIAEIPASQPIRIGALVFPRMDQVDLTGPYAVLSRLPNSTFRLLWKDSMPVRDYHGLGLIPDARLGRRGPVDLLVIPGGPGQEGLMEDEEVLAFIAERAAAARCVFSVCTGALICGAAGLLKGRSATTHWASFSFLKYFGAVPVDERVVVDGTFVSAAGLTAGIDGALRVASLLRGEEAAKGDPAGNPVCPGAALRLRHAGSGPRSPRHQAEEGRGAVGGAPARHGEAGGG